MKFPTTDSGRDISFLGSGGGGRSSSCKSLQGPMQCTTPSHDTIVLASLGVSVDSLPPVIPKSIFVWTPRAWAEKGRGLQGLGPSSLIEAGRGFALLGAAVLAPPVEGRLP